MIYSQVKLEVFEVNFFSKKGGCMGFFGKPFFCLFYLVFYSFHSSCFANGGVIVYLYEDISVFQIGSAFFENLE